MNFYMNFMTIEFQNENEFSRRELKSTTKISPCMLIREGFIIFVCHVVGSLR